MDSSTPMVSICMAAYNHERFIGKAIESVVNQKTDFPIQLIIGEDCSKDRTREICEKYAVQYPDKILLLPSDSNWGMSKNGMRIMQQARGKYVAILDGDDYWSDPHKLRDQVAFMEQNPDYALVHTDIDAVDDDGNFIENELVNERRTKYQNGHVFFKLMEGYNFISSCTALFRHEYLTIGDDGMDKYWYSFDYWYWLRLAMRGKVHYMNKRTACYRIHAGGITNTSQFHADTPRQYHFMYDVISEFDNYAVFPLEETQKRVIFKKILSLLYRKQGSIPMKLRLLGIIPRYFPGLAGVAHVFLFKAKKLIPSFASKTA